MKRCSLVQGALALSVLLGASTLRAQMVVMEAGRLHDLEDRNATYAWRLDYRQRVSEGWAVSGGWLNEGHVPDHHRDGWVVQGWRYWQPTQGPLVLALGAGLYRWFDTQTTPEGAYTDAHGYRALFSAGAWYFAGPQSPWVGMLELNRTARGDEPQTQSILAGLGFRMGKPLTESSLSTDVEVQDIHQSVDFYYGTAIRNSFQSETASAYQVEYRRNFRPTWEWSLGYCSEGNLGPIRREGLVSQAWYGGWFMDQRLHLAFGAGAYLNRIGESDSSGKVEDHDVRISPRVTLSIQYRPTAHGLISLAWNRTGTSFDEDSDVIVGGIGYAW